MHQPTKQSSSITFRRIIARRTKTREEYRQTEFSVSADLLMALLLAVVRFLLS